MVYRKLRCLPTREMSFQSIYISRIYMDEGHRVTEKLKDLRSLATAFTRRVASQRVYAVAGFLKRSRSQTYKCNGMTVTAAPTKAAIAASPEERIN